MKLYIVIGILTAIHLKTDAQFFDISTRVLGGSPTNIESYPIIGQFLLDFWGNRQFVQYCAGVILTARHVISAAHCFQYNKGTSRNYSHPKNWKLRVGSSFRSGGGSLINLKRFNIHPAFDKGFYTNDIAVAMTSHPIPFSDNVRQATIPQGHIEIKDNSVVTLIGWGASQVGGEQSEQLLKVNMRTIDQKTCRDRYKDIGAVISDSMLCAGKLNGGGVDGCYGDSGGPLIFNGYVVGLVSFGYACGHHYYPGVYTKISFFTNWILKSVS